MGVDRHQLDITSLRIGINEEAHRVAAGGPLSWQAVTQIMLAGCIRPDGSPYTVYRDVCVFLGTKDRTRGSYALARDGPPALMVGVAGESTCAADLDPARGKAWSYRHAGVAVLDPTGAYLPALGRGRRLQGGVYVPWLPDAAWRWRSARIGVAIGVEGGLAAVYGAAGERQFREGEMIGPALEARRREGRTEGIAEGRVGAKRELAQRLVRVRFGAVPGLERRIDVAAEAALDALLYRALTAPSPDDL